MKKYLIIITLLLSAFNHSFAAKHHADNKCKPSKNYIDNYEPTIFNTNNNLLNSYDNMPQLCSDQIIIRGRVLDENCNPVVDAKVQVWQVGCDGKYPYMPLKNRSNKKLINLNPQSSFLGSGTATTNNLGEFKFITMMPVRPHFNYINLRVLAKNLGTVQTRLFINYKLATNRYNTELHEDDND